MKMLAAPAAGLIVLAMSAGAALADGHEAKVQAYLDAHVWAWLASPEIINGIDQQNIDNMALTDADIEVLDQRWRQEKLRGG